MNIKLELESHFFIGHRGFPASKVTFMNAKTVVTWTKKLLFLGQLDSLVEYKLNKQRDKSD